ncbi:hypothetical protein EHE19_003310 [Ruminiclostridium herbifermentans]|uniref:Glycerophosphoryl diester phosphodiesterase membrane domain-containing protein n=1 Tax=Ruminiclostridium herbifermentans TaxID=2488810 RepID=A0A4U7JHI1_9FIRM|nr:DUF2207 domain-containing protein [Ruminiclostridium herbifermentans]QNU67559.1 hypothetical protein EHE19_003310 [Ruminiclostridium herbifermentans]
METLNNAVRLLTKRPSILVLTILLSIIISIVENLFITLFYGVSMFKTGSPFDAYINIIHFLVNTMLVPQTAVKVILILIILVVAFALIFGLLFSGYFNILNNGVQGKTKKEGSEFIAGVKKYFFRMISLNLWTLSLGILFLIYLFIAFIPAAIFIDSAFSGAINIFAGILLFIITILVLFFSYAFFRQYLVFWYPSAMIYDKNHFKIAKKISDKNFWPLLSKLIIFDIAAVVFDSVYIIANFSLANAQVVSGATSNLLLIINIVYKTVYIALLVCFVFSSFNKYNKNLNKIAAED